MTIDPLSVNRQGNDIGTQYRTGIYYLTDDAAPEDVELVEDIYTVLEEVKARVGRPLAVEVLPLQNFYTAEEYHQKYLDKNPGGYCHIPRNLLHLEAE